MLLGMGQNTAVLMSNLNVCESFCLLKLDANVCLLSSYQVSVLHFIKHAYLLVSEGEMRKLLPSSGRGLHNP